jgi:Arc/MetJ-type ribon-helix-helix transcriptional regulator
MCSRPLELAPCPTRSLLPSQFYLLCRFSRKLHSTSRFSHICRSRPRGSIRSFASSVIATIATLPSIPEIPLNSVASPLSRRYPRGFTFYVARPRAPFLGLKAWPLLSLPAVGGHPLQRCSVKALERENEGDSHIDRLYGCPKLCYMRETLTVSLPREMRREVTRAAKRQKLTASEYVRDAVRRKLWLDAFDETRRKLLPKARALGIYTDEDVFKIVS